ncbi:MAG: hypothetical protein JWR80_8530 [Bradyrhizobium sp.]|nr:hypothetical protein [Bradyrhizobium sp.]
MQVRHLLRSAWAGHAPEHGERRRIYPLCASGIAFRRVDRASPHHRWCRGPARKMLSAAVANRHTYHPACSDEQRDLFASDHTRPPDMFLGASADSNDPPRQRAARCDSNLAKVSASSGDAYPRDWFKFFILHKPASQLRNASSLTRNGMVHIDRRAAKRGSPSVGSHHAVACCGEWTARGLSCWQLRHHQAVSNPGWDRVTGR